MSYLRFYAREQGGGLVTWQGQAAAQRVITAKTVKFRTNF